MPTIMSYPSPNIYMFRILIVDLNPYSYLGITFLLKPFYGHHLVISFMALHAPYWFRREYWNCFNDSSLLSVRVYMMHFYSPCYIGNQQRHVPSIFMLIVCSFYCRRKTEIRVSLSLLPFSFLVFD